MTTWSIVLTLSGQPPVVLSGYTSDDWARRVGNSIVGSNPGATFFLVPVQ